jgi:hypothetical protein
MFFILPPEIDSFWLRRVCLHPDNREAATLFPPKFAVGEGIN